MQLGHYLLQQRDNDFVYVHSVRGFSSDDVLEAMHEAELIASGTRAKKHLFSLSLNPPHGADVNESDFDAAIQAVEKALGLSGQPRIAVVHEKGDRDRHMHVVFSRIDSEQMKAIPVPYNRMKLKDVSKSLFIKHDWDLPKGYIDRSKRDPLRYSLEEYRHAKRNGVHPQEVKAALQDAWASSDSSGALNHALQERGFRLARGDRRGYLAVDHNGKPYSLSRWIGVKTKAVRDRLGDDNKLQSLADTREAIGRDMRVKLDEYRTELKQQNEARIAQAERTRFELVERQRDERHSHLKRMEDRQLAEAKARQSKFRNGLGFVWDMIRGENRRTRALNEREAAESRDRDSIERANLIARQRVQRSWQRDRQKQQAITIRDTCRDVAKDRRQYVQMQTQDVNRKREAFTVERERQPSEQKQRRKRGRGPEP